jgi:hypothetical protein
VQILLDAERALARCGARGMEKHIWQMGHAPISAMRQVHRRLAVSLKATSRRRGCTSKDESQRLSVAQFGK